MLFFRGFCRTPVKDSSDDFIFLFYIFTSYKNAADEKCTTIIYGLFRLFKFLHYEKGEC